MTEPLPCPFCGSEILDSGANQHSGQRPFGWVDCHDCEASGPTKSADTWEEATELGIVAWNKAVRQ